jgi:hypothetical protein
MTIVIRHRLFSVQKPYEKFDFEFMQSRSKNKPTWNKIKKFISHFNVDPTYEI